MIQTGNVLPNNLIIGLVNELRTHMNAIIGLSYLSEKESDQGSNEASLFDDIFISCKQLTWVIENYLTTVIELNEDKACGKKIYNIDLFLEDLLSEIREIIEHKKGDNIILIHANENRGTSEVIDIYKVVKVVRSLVMNVLNTNGRGYILIGNYKVGDEIVFYVIDSLQDYYRCRQLLYDDYDISDIKPDEVSKLININIARVIVRSLGGEIWLKTIDDKTPRFYFSIPVNNYSEEENSIQIDNGYYYSSYLY